MRRFGIFSAIFFLWALYACSLQAQFRFTTKASSSRVGLNDPFQINFVLDNATQLSGFTPPEFTGFDLLQQSQSSSISDNNGQVSETITYSYLLRPRSLGAFTIAGATARESGNKVESNPVTIEVVKDAPATGTSAAAPSAQRGWTATPGGVDPGTSGTAGELKKGELPMDLIKKNLFAKATVDKNSVYQGQQITATYKLYTRLNVSSQVTKVPAFTGFSSHDIRIPNPVPANIEKLNGVSYNVFLIRKTMLFPLQTGKLELDPVEIHNTVRLFRVNKTSRNNDPFGDIFNDPFFKDPFGNDPFGNADVSYQDFNYNAASVPLEINVKPLPEAGQPGGFSGAVGNFSVEASLDKSRLTTDDAATLAITVSGNGNIDMIGPPKPEFPATMDAYDPKVTDRFNKNSNPFSGSRTFEYVFMPRAAGTYIIPPVSFSYFNPDLKRYKTIDTQPFRIRVTQGKGISSQAPGGLAAAGELQPLLYAPLRGRYQGSLYLGSWWFWLLMVVPVLILVTILMMRSKSRRLKSDMVLFLNRKANKVALNRLHTAQTHLRAKDEKPFYEEISRAVWGYLSHKLNIPYASLSREKATQQLEEAGIPHPETDKLFVLLDECQVALYAPHQGQGKMQRTYKDALEIIGSLESHLK
jgi:hypothetical protein